MKTDAEKTLHKRIQTATTIRHLTHQQRASLHAEIDDLDVMIDIIGNCRFQDKFTSADIAECASHFEACKTIMQSAAIAFKQIKDLINALGDQAAMSKLRERYTMIFDHLINLNKADSFCDWYHEDICCPEYSEYCPGDDCERYHVPECTVKQFLADPAIWARKQLQGNLRL